MKALIEKMAWENQYHKILLDSMKKEVEGLPKGYLVPKTGKGILTSGNSRRNHQIEQRLLIKLLTGITN